MDSLTHLFLGGAIAAAIAPPHHRRAALLAGAALNSLPDLDVVPLILSNADPVVRMTWHRGATHSLFVLPFVAWALWAWFRRRGGRVAEAPRRWFWVFLCTLLAHPLIDAFTVYGTQLLWPLPMPPVMWSTLFIIDPLFALPLLLACVVAWFARERVSAQRALACGLALAVAYVGWSVLAKSLVEREAQRALAQLGLANAPRFSVPTPFTTQRWRVVAMTPGGFVEGERSVRDARPMRFVAHASDVAALHAVSGFPAAARLLWFNHHFAKAEVGQDGALVLSDLRMGAEPDYTFRFIVAERDGVGWREVPPRQPGMRLMDALPRLWRRFRERQEDDAVTDGERAADDSAVPPQPR